MSRDLVEVAQVFNFNDLHSTFNLVIKPVSTVIDWLKEKKDPDTLDIFFIKCIEFFQLGAERAEDCEQQEMAHKARLMCIDVHKLRLLCVGDSAFQFSHQYMTSLTLEYPGDGRFWFQLAILEFTFDPSKQQQQQQQQQITKFETLNPLFRSLLATSNPIDCASVSLFLEKREISADFSNTLLALSLKDFQDFTSKDLQTWSFVKYFQTFFAENDSPISQVELANLLLFVFAFYRISRNSFHLKIFFESFLSAKNQSISDFWPFAVFSLLHLAAAQQDAETKAKDVDDSSVISDTIWFKIFQLLKSESLTIISASSSLTTFSNFKSFFLGTILSNLPSQPGSTDYDFDEEFSIERDSIINEISTFFDHSSGSFKHFITMRSDRTLRLGSHFCSSQDPEAKIESSDYGMVKQVANYSLNETYNLDDSIEELRFKLASLTTTPTAAQLEESPNYLNCHFVIDTNILLSGSPAVRTELLQRPDRFLVPLVVLKEVLYLRDSFGKAHYAHDAWNFLEPLISTSLNVYNNYGRLLRPEEITNQLAFLDVTRTLTVNDDQIIELANQFHSNFPQLSKPIVITEDLNMRLKAKSKSVRAISVKDFRNMCNC